MEKKYIIQIRMINKENNKLKLKARKRMQIIKTIIINMMK